MRHLFEPLDHFRPGIVIPQYAVTFNATSTRINCGNGYGDMSAASFTIDGWWQNEYGGTNDTLFLKLNTDWNRGFSLATANTNCLEFYMWTSGTDPHVKTPSNTFLRDETWYHVAVYFDYATSTPHIAINGTWYSGTAGAGFSSDELDNFMIGAHEEIYNVWDGKIAWVRMSDNNRHAYPSNFTPPAKDAPPAIDANTIEQWNLNEGSGSTAAAQVNSPTNDGTITNGTWSSL